MTMQKQRIHVSGEEGKGGGRTMLGDRGPGGPASRPTRPPHLPWPSSPWHSRQARD